MNTGGGGYAAAKLPTNSVGPAQLTRNADTSGKVKDGTLRRQDATGQAELSGSWAYTAP